MNAINRRVARTHRGRSSVLVKAASFALTAGVLLPFTTAARAAPHRHPASTGSPLCTLLAHATPGSAAAFRIAETIADLGQSCDPPPLCTLLAHATPGSAAAFRIAETIEDSGEKC